MKGPQTSKYYNADDTSSESEHKSPNSSMNIAEDDEMEFKGTPNFAITGSP